METTPPTYEAIASFMAQCTAKLPSLFASWSAAEELALAGRRILPYEYNGCDYALVLAACFPAKREELSSLNWSEQPLAAQLRGNLGVFCDAAQGLGLPDAPVCSLHPSALQPEASCVVHHLKVQHWLYSLSRRFPPDTTRFDPVTIRALQSWRQLGTPFLSLKRTREETVVAVNHPERCCEAVWQTPCLSVERLRRLGYALAPTPAYTEAAAEDSGSHDDTRGAPEDGEKENAPITAPALATAADNATAKPWLRYSKPWRLPAVEAANARRAKAEAAAARRREALLQGNPVLNAFTTNSSNLKEQLEASQRAADELRRGIEEVQRAVLEEVLAGRGSVDYPAVAAKLRKVGVTPDA